MGKLDEIAISVIMPKINILGVPHSYELLSPRDCVNSPVLIFVHGWLLSQRYWQPLTSRLAEHYHCLTYDLRGFGDSQPLCGSTLKDGSGQYTLGAYAKDLKILLEKLNIDQAWLIGHSLGGSIALWAADYCQERVKGVICLNAGGGIYLKEEFERFRQAGQQILKQRPQWLPLVPFISLVFARMMVCRPLDASWGQQRVIDFVKANQEAALGSLLESTTETEVHRLPQLVARLPQPVYFLAGSQDAVMELKYVRHLASFHPSFAQSGINVLEIPNCGHLAMLEQPALVVEYITRILGNHS